MIIKLLLYFFYAVDHTRIKLKDINPNELGADYINANLIKVCIIFVTFFFFVQYINKFRFFMLLFHM